MRAELGLRPHLPTNTHVTLSKTPSLSEPQFLTHTGVNLHQEVLKEINSAYSLPDGCYILNTQNNPLRRVMLLLILFYRRGKQGSEKQLAPVHAVGPGVGLQSSGLIVLLPVLTQHLALSTPLAHNSCCYRYYY